jgi:hypothetical protein
MTDRRVPPNPDAPAVSRTHADRLAEADRASAEGYDAIEAAGEAVAELGRALAADQGPPQVDTAGPLCSSGTMKIKGTITRVVPAAGDTGALVFFRPDDPVSLRRVRTASLTSAGEVIVPAGAEERTVGEQAEFELASDEDETKPDAPKTDDKG